MGVGGHPFAHTQLPLDTHSHTGTAAQKPEPRAETEGQETQSGLAGDMTVKRGAGGGGKKGSWQ